MIRTRRAKTVIINLLSIVIVNVHLWKGLPTVMSAGLFLYYCWLLKYAWNKTKICPLEIMGRTSLLCWPRAFRLMYKRSAARMMILYFSCAGLVILKGVLLVAFFINWLGFKL